MNPETQQSESPYCVKIEAETGQSATVPIATLTPKELEVFLQSEFKRLAQEAGVKGDSSNYPPENRYFRCFALGLEILACVADESEFAEYDFDLHLKAEFWRGDSEFLFELADCIARRLVVNGYEVLRPFDSSRFGQGGVRYRFDPTAGTMPSQQVITHEI